MFKKLLPLMVLLMASSLAFGAECTDGTIADYTAANFTCTIGDKVFSDFSFTITGSGSLTSFLIQPFISGNEEGFNFVGGYAVGPGPALLDVFIDYKVATIDGSATIGDALLEVAGAGVTGGAGVVSVVENLCLGGTFPGCVGGTLATLQVVGNGSQIINFDPVSSLHANKDILLYASGEGSFAFASRVTNGFSQVPEPASLGLLGAGFVFGGYLLRRKFIVG